MRFVDPIETFCQTASDRELAKKLAGWDGIAGCSDDWEARKWVRSLREEIDARRQLKAARYRYRASHCAA